jgi:hypothetical protein
MAPGRLRGIMGGGALMLVAVCLLVSTWAESPEPTLRLIAFGDHEGVIARPGDDPSQKNPVLPRLLEILRQQDAQARIDLLLHTGDLVRFDPSPQLFMQALGPFLERFYPTTGGDEEFLQGKYWAFLRAVPHLRDLVLRRVAQDHNGFEPYYAVTYKGLHLISLHNPENYAESERYPEFAGYDLFRPDHANQQQYRWLVAQLEAIRSQPNHTTPIVVLSHRPIYNQSHRLVELFDRYRVDVVLSGDVHVYARTQSRHTLYIVSGIMGDRVVGGCERLNVRLAEAFLGQYQRCVPELGMSRKGTFAYHYDHYVDLRLQGRMLQGQAVEIADGRVLDTFTHGVGN